MPNQFVEHKDRWLLLSEHSDFEFALLFIRTWIPFNAWYCNNYPALENNDSRILRLVKSDNNLFRTRIISLLKGTDGESKNFRNIIGALHSSLEKFYVPSHINRISFLDLHFRDNPQKVFTESKWGINYQAELMTNANNEVTGAKLIMIKSISGSSKLSYQHNKYSETHLLQDNDFKALSERQKLIAEKCFTLINPRRKESLLSSSNYIMLGEYKFVNDVDLLSQAIIQVLYRLRCILFHGEIQPSRDNLSVYEYAYSIMRILIKSLK